MSEWPRRRLAELAAEEKSAISKPYGSAILQSDYRSAGIPVVRGVNLARGTFHDNDFVFIDDSLASRMPGAQLRAGDLVVTHRGTIGQVSMIPRSPRFERYVASTSHVKVRLDKDRAISEFYYYWFASERGKQTILEHASAVGVPGIAQPVSAVKSLLVPHPPLATQRGIAKMLSVLDNKIAANGRVVARVEELARAHFEALPGKARVPLSSLARFVNGRAFTKGATGTGRIVVRIAELNSGIGDSTVYNDIEVADEHLARPGDLLFAWSGSLTVARWYRPEAIVNQHIFKVIPNDGVPMWLVDQAVRAKLDEFKAIAADKATTMGHIQRRHLDEPVAIPAADEVRRIDCLMTGLWEAALAAEVESLKLTQTRDELLPLLMSGKVRVRDADRAAGEVL
jgi:type I restriction enzyme S subunit